MSLPRTSVETTFGTATTAALFGGIIGASVGGLLPCFELTTALPRWGWWGLLAFGLFGVSFAVYQAIRFDNKISGLLRSVYGVPKESKEEGVEDGVSLD